MDPFKCQDAHLLGFRVFSPAVSQGYPGLNVAFPGDGMRWDGLGRWGGEEEREGRRGRGEEEGEGSNLLVYCGQDEKYRRVIIDIIPCVVVTSLETDAFVAIIAYFDMLISERGTQREVEEEGTQGAVAILRRKKRSKVVHLKIEIQ